MVEAQAREDYVYLAKLAEQAERYEGEKPVKIRYHLCPPIESVILLEVILEFMSFMVMM